MDQVIFIHVGHIRKLIKREIFLEMVVDVPPYQAALLADFALRRIRGKGKTVPPQQTQQNHVQQMIADRLIPGLSAAGLLGNQAQAPHDFLPAGVEMQLCKALCVGENFQTVHAENRVFHRRACLAQLRMRYRRVYHEQIADRYGKTVLLQLKAPSSAGHKEQLGAGMGVERGVPFLAELGAADIQQSGVGFFDSRAVSGRHDVVGGIHR